MNQIIEGIVANLRVSVPVTTPAQIDPHGLGGSQNITSEQGLTFPVIPLDGLGRHINRTGRHRIVLAIRPTDLALAFSHHLVLTVFIPVPFQNGAVEVLNHLMKNPLQERVTGGEFGQGFFRKTWHH